MVLKKCSDNPFNYQGSESLDERTLKRKKENSVYIWKIAINIWDRGGYTDNLAAEYLAQILSGRLLNTTCPRDNETGAKLKGLLIALDEPANRERFVRSYFAAAVSAFRTGALDGNADDTWVNYKPTPVNTTKKSAINTALVGYKDDPAFPVGLDMDKFLDTIMKKEGGKYVMTNISAREGELLLKAAIDNVKMMRECAEFKRNFAKVKG